MDSLALLCNLHADGPATLGQLRRAGCQSLADLQRLAPQELADLLQVPPAMARRLNREARILADRVGEDPLDPEEAPENVAVPFVEADPSPARGSTQAAVERLRPIDREIVDQALSRQPAFRSHADQPKNGQAEPRNQPTWEWGDAKQTQPNVAQNDEVEAAPVVPPPALAPKPHPGAALIGAVDGLDRVVAGALAAAGVNTIEDLIDRDAGPLARQTGLNFSRVRRFQFLARRALLSEHEPAPAPKSEPLPPRAPQSPAAQTEATEATTASQPEPSVQEIVPAPAPTPKFTARHDVATPFGAPLLPKELQTIADEPIHLPAKSENIAEQPASIDLPDHPVAEFEPQSGGPMVAPQALDAPWRPEELGDGEAAQGAAGDEAAETILDPKPVQEEAPSVVEDEPNVETPVTPLGRWVPRALRGVEETPIECVEPEPVLVPPPPPRRFWEPKRFWEARKNRREKAALEARSETENLPDPEEAVASPVLPEVPRPTQTDRQPSVTPATPTDGAVPWDFSTPEGSAQNAGTRAAMSRKDSTLEAPRGKGFEFSEANKETTREDASGPFA